MRKSLVFLLSVVALVQAPHLAGAADAAAAAEVAWTYGGGGGGDDFFGALQPLEDGSILTMWSEDNGTVTYAKKFDAPGNLLWSQPVPAVENSGPFSASGSVIAANGDTLFFGTVAQDVRVDAYTSDAAIVSMDSLGTVTKYIQFGGSGSDFIKSIAMCSDGSFFVGGTVWSASIDPGNTSPIGLVDLFISRFDANLNKLWIKQLGSTDNDALFSMRCDSTNTVSMSAWGAASINGAGDDDYYNFYLIKYDSTGAIKSTLMTERDVGFWSPQGGATASDGSYYVVGEHNSEKLGSLPCTEQSLGGSFISKYSAIGDLLWRQIIDCANLNRSAAIDSWGNIYVLGSALSRRIAGQQKFGGDDMLLHKYTSSGERLWTRQFGSSTDEYAMVIALDTSGNVLIGGQGKGVIDGYTPQGGWDVFLMKNRVGETGVASPPPTPTPPEVPVAPPTPIPPGLNPNSPVAEPTPESETKTSPTPTQTTSVNATTIMRLSHGGTLSVQTSARSGKTTTWRKLLDPGKGVVLTKIRSLSRFVCIETRSSVRMLKSGTCRLAVTARFKSRSSTSKVTIVVAKASQS